ncbi:MFS transporter [Pseudomonas monteilii]|uniref:MFS transporter n=1 Tax=Pseudomonas monteilii TaxID=76759 RepID=UPI003D065AB3
MSEKWTWNQRNVVIATMGSWTLDAFDFFLMIFLLTDIAKDFQVGMSEVSVAILVTLVARPLGALLFGNAAEKYGRKPVLMANVIIFSAFEMASAFSPTLTAFLLLRVFYGIAMGGIWGVASSLAMESIPARSKGFISGVFQAGYACGYLLAAIIYGLLFEHLGWRGLFVVGAAPALMAIFIWFKVPESPVWLARKSRAEKISLWPIIKREWRIVVFSIGLMTCFTFFSHGTQDLYPTFLKLNHGFDAQVVSMIAIVYSIAAIFGGIVFGALSEVLGRVKTVLLAIGLTIPLIPFWAFSEGIHSVVITAIMMQFLVQGSWGVIPAYLNEISPEGTRAVLPGFVYQFGNLIASVNAPLQTMIALRHGGDYAYAMAYVVGTVVVSIGIFMIFSTGIVARAKAATAAPVV